MGGFNRLFEIFTKKNYEHELVPDFTRHYGYGRVNQWAETDAKELAEALRDSGCNATICEFLEFGDLHFAHEPEQLFEPARAFTRAMRRQGIWTHWTIINWNIGEGLAENGKEKICAARFDDQWFAGMLGFFVSLARDGGVSVLPCSELGVRNTGCKAKGLRWHKSARDILGAQLTRWNGNGNARPLSAPAGECVEYHIARTSDMAYKRGSLIVSDTSSVLNELGGLKTYVSDHARLRKIVEQAKKNNCGFLHYGFFTPSIDHGAIHTIGSAAQEP